MRKYKDHIVITDAMYQQLIAQKQRTGMGAIVIYGHMQREGLLPPDHHITVQRIESWFTRIAKMASEADFDAVIKAYESISDEEVKKGNPRCSEQRVPLSQDFIDDLNAVLKDRPNFSINTFLKRTDTPEGFSASKLSSILTGRVKTIAVTHKEFLEKAFLSKPEKNA